MAYIGMRNPVAAPITAETDGSPITYGAGLVLGPAVAANLTMNVNDNPDYGDDVIIDNDNGINGYSGTLETNNITAEGRAMVLGWQAVSSGTPSAVTHYAVSDKGSPYVGWGFIRVKLFKGVRSYEAFWFHKAQFNPASINGSTKQQQITWNHPQMNVTGMGAYIDASGEAKYFDWMEFSTEAAAQAWLYGRANIQTTAATT